MGVVLPINLFVVGLACLLLSQTRTHYENRAATVAQNLSQVLLQSISGVIAGTERAVRAVGLETEAQLASGGIQPGRLQAVMERQFANQPALESLWVVGSDGRVLHGIGAKMESSDNVADRRFFRRLSDRRYGGLVISHPRRGADGKWTVNLARRLTRPDGSFAGVSYAVLNLEQFRKMFAALDLGRHGLVSLRELDQSMVVRYPDPGGPEQGVRNRLVSGEFLKAIQQHPEAGSYRARTKVDGLYRTISYRKVPIYPAYIIVGLAEDDYLSAWRTEAIRILGLVALFSLSTLIAARLAVRGSRRRTSALLELEERDRKYRLLFENMTTGFALHQMIFDDRGAPLDYRFIEVNPAFERVVGLPASQLVGMTVREAMPEIEEYWIEQYGTVARTGEPLAYQNYARALGRYYDVWAFCPKLGYFAVIVNDITERKEAEAKQRLMAQVFEQSGDAILITDPDNRIIATNSSFTVLTGYSQEEALGQNPRMLKSGRESQEFYQAMWELLLRDNYWQGEIWEKRKDGSFYPKWLTITVIRDGQGNITNYIGSFSDISERKQAELKIAHMAHHDALTNLPNRFSLSQRLSQSLEQARRANQHLAVIFIDLDRFKNINDSLGHHVGDLLLFEVAARLSKTVRSSDIVARLGGDEFVVVLPQVPSGIAAAHLVNKIQGAICRPYNLDGHELHVTPSMGISVFPHDGEEVEVLMQNADAAMYHAKAQGRNNYQFFRKEMNDKAQERLLLENDLRQAIEKRQFIVHYQPQIEAIGGKVIGVEALVRWQHPSRGMVPPDDFIPVAEDTGLILPLGEMVLEIACRQLARWVAEGVPPIRMAVNLSARQFQQNDLPETVARIMKETGVNPSLVELEITETVAMSCPDETISNLVRFKEMGVTLAIDDFGTGYSSLGYLKLFPVNRLKIDKSFVNDLRAGSNDAAIAAATIGLAHTLGMEVVAEGVETGAQLEFLQYQQCEVVQGYFFSHPLPAGEATAFIRSNLLGSGTCDGGDSSLTRAKPAPKAKKGYGAAGAGAATHFPQP